MGPRVIVIFGLGLVAALVLLLVVRRMICLVGPSELLVISGPRRRVGDQVLGYRLLRAGRALRWPWIERIDRLDLTVLPVAVSHQGLLSKGMVPLSIELEVFVRVAGQAPTADAAAQCLLGKTDVEIGELAAALIGGSLAHVVASCAPEQIQSDPSHFENLVTAEAEHELRSVGLEIDQLALRSVTDDLGYLAAAAQLRKG
jgi:flotillin